MQITKKFYCHWAAVRYITEDYLKQKDGTLKTLSITDGGLKEYMIFLGKNDSDYEVRVHKASPRNTYNPSENDRVKYYEENDEYATFIFDQFDDARHFVEVLGFAHPEYLKRVVKIIGKDS